jgi:hypothetical protein
MRRNTLMNQQIVKWFQEGKFYESLVGAGEYFVMEHTYQNDHDLILVISTMIKWAFEKRGVEDSSDKFVSALVKICKEDPIKALDIINCYLIVSEAIKMKLSVEFESLYDILIQSIKGRTDYGVSERKQMSLLMEAIGKKLPAFRKWKEKGQEEPGRNM